MNMISFIVPCYNVDLYLEKCINSLLNQSYKNFEIIIINDGSEDSTLQIAKQMVQNDKRIILLNQMNQGVSEARNNGIRHSKGDYIIFIDPDDYVHKEFSKALLDGLSQTRADLCVCGHTKVYENGSELKSSCSNEVFYNEKIIEQYFIGESTLTVLTCDKLFKADIIRKNNIYFPKEVTSGQDQVFILNYLMYCKAVSTICNNYYYYYQRIGSKSKRYEYDIFLKTIIKLEIIKKILYTNNILNNYQRFYEIRLYMNLFSQGFLLYQYSDKKTFKKQFKKMKQDSISFINKSISERMIDLIIRSRLNIKERIACFIIYYMPISVVKMLYRFYLKQKMVN